MLATATHLPSWRTSSYVCLSCRRQSILPHVRRQQIRWTATEEIPRVDGSHDISNSSEFKPPALSKIMNMVIKDDKTAELVIPSVRSAEHSEMASFRKVAPGVFSTRRRGRSGRKGEPRVWRKTLVRDTSTPANDSIKSKEERKPRQKRAEASTKSKEEGKPRQKRAKGSIKSKEEDKPRHTRPKASSQEAVRNVDTGNASMDPDALQKILRDLIAHLKSEIKAEQKEPDQYRQQGEDGVASSSHNVVDRGVAQDRLAQAVASSQAEGHTAKSELREKLETVSTLLGKMNDRVVSSWSEDDLSKLKSNTSTTMRKTRTLANNGRVGESGRSSSQVPGYTQIRRSTQQDSTTPEKVTLESTLGSQSIADAMNPRSTSEASQAQFGEENARERVVSVEMSALQIDPLDVPQPPIPYLQYGLDRVLFNPGIYQLQDPSSRVYNFDPYLQKIMPVMEFDFNSLRQYKTSSQDTVLAALAQEHGKKYVGSTSSMTSSLTHFHYLLSNWRPLNVDSFTKGFGKSSNVNFTEINKAPSSIFLRWKGGTYAIDADKEYDGANVLMLLGKSMELLLTAPTSDYERYRKSDPREVSDEQKSAPEAYQYTTMKDFLMRSQLDAYDPRLPGNGTFDLKTRAVVSVRMDAQDFEPMTGYEIHGLHGKWGSYEKEMYDMMRSTMLKYMLQARMGRMNGIFVAYHNVKRIFGFQYIPMHEMDRLLHGQTDSCLGDQEFKASLEIMNDILNKATAKFPEQSLRIHFETTPVSTNGTPIALHAFAEPMAEEDIDRIQSSTKAKIQAFEREMLGKEAETRDDETTVKSGHGQSVQQEQVLSDKASPEENESDNQEGISLRSSSSDADTEFIRQVENARSGDPKPLFYASVILQHKVNGKVPAEGRPSKLRAQDKWDVDYILQEYEITHRHWALYDDMKTRRRYAFSDQDREAEDGGDPEAEGVDKREDSYITFLRSLSAQGAKLRKEVDELEAGREVVWLEQGLPPHRERIEGVEDYMGWLYQKKNVA